MLLFDDDDELSPPPTLSLVLLLLPPLRDDEGFLMTFMVQSFLLLFAFLAVGDGVGVVATGEKAGCQQQEVQY